MPKLIWQILAVFNSVQCASCINNCDRRPLSPTCIPQNKKEKLPTKNVARMAILVPQGKYRHCTKLSKHKDLVPTFKQKLAMQLLKTLKSASMQFFRFLW